MNIWLLGFAAVIAKAGERSGVAMLSRGAREELGVPPNSPACVGVLNLGDAGCRGSKSHRLCPCRQDPQQTRCRRAGPALPHCDPQCCLLHRNRSPISHHPMLWPQLPSLPSPSSLFLPAPPRPLIRGLPGALCRDAVPLLAASSPEEPAGKQGAFLPSWFLFFFNWNLC